MAARTTRLVPRQGTVLLLGCLIWLSLVSGAWAEGSDPFAEGPVAVQATVAGGEGGATAVVSGPGEPLGPGGLSVRVAGYNIAHARGNKSGWLNERGKLKNLRGIATLLKEQKVDIIGFTKISDRDLRVCLIDQPKFIAERLGFHHAYHANVSRGWGGILTNGGNAVGSRFPILSSVKHALYHADPKSEPRGCVEAFLDLGEGRRLRLLVAHLSLRKDESARQVEEIWALVEKSADPVILVGDFNLRPGSEAVRFLGGKMKDATANLTTTYLDKPHVKIDYHFTHGPVTGGTARVLGFAEGYSDHGCLINDYRITFK